MIVPVYCKWLNAHIRIGWLSEVPECLWPGDTVRFVVPVPMPISPENFDANTPVETVDVKLSELWVGGGKGKFPSKMTVVLVDPAMRANLLRIPQYTEKDGR